MRIIPTLLVVWLAATGASAAAPEFVDDPFGDSDFDNTPMIMEVNQPTSGRAELGIAFVTSMIDKYSAHNGAMVDATYHLGETWGLGLSLGMLHGGLTSIVTDPAGIVGNNANKCLDDTTGEACADINAQVPDYKQITGVADVYVIWSPLYGKVNVVSEGDVNVHLYGIAGAGFNGTREIRSQMSASRARPLDPSDYAFSGGGFLEGGAFGGMKLNATAGLGLKVYVTPWMSIRGEVRGIFFRDAFAFRPGEPELGYTSSYWFGHAGMSFVLF